MTPAGRDPSLPAGGGAAVGNATADHAFAIRRPCSIPLITVGDAAGTLVEVFTIPGLTEEFHAITQRRRFPNPLLVELLEG